MEYAVLTRCVSELYVLNGHVFVNVEDKKCLQLNVKVLNELASVIGKALKMNEFAVWNIY